MGERGVLETAFEQSAGVCNVDGVARWVACLRLILAFLCFFLRPPRHTGALPDDDELHLSFFLHFFFHFLPLTEGLFWNTTAIVGASCVHWELAFDFTSAQPTLAQLTMSTYVGMSVCMYWSGPMGSDKCYLASSTLRATASRTRPGQRLL